MTRSHWKNIVLATAVCNLATTSSAGQIKVIKPQLDFTSISYRENGVPDYKATALTAKLTLGEQLGKSGFDFGLSGFMTVMTLSKSSAENATFIGVNIRFGWRIPFGNGPVALRLLVGGYYTTMNVTNDAFGFANMMGPQVYPVLSIDLGKTSMLAFFGKYSPISRPGKIFDFLSREIAVGFTYAFEFNSAVRWSLEGSWAHQDINITDTTTFIMTADSMSVGLGMAF